MQTDTNNNGVNKSPGTVDVSGDFLPDILDGVTWASLVGLVDKTAIEDFFDSLAAAQTRKQFWKRWKTHRRKKSEANVLFFTFKTDPAVVRLFGHLSLFTMEQMILLFNCLDGDLQDTLKKWSKVLKLKQNKKKAAVLILHAVADIVDVYSSFLTPARTARLNEILEIGGKS